MLPLPCDVSDPDAVDGMFTRIESAFDRLDLLFNNAGTNVPATNFGELSWSAWKKVIDVNLNGMFLCASGAFRLMQRQRPHGGRLLNNGPISAHSPLPASAPYTPPNHAATAPTRPLTPAARPLSLARAPTSLGTAAPTRHAHHAKNP